MDWWRAKLVLIAAFLCLDVMLVWEVHRLRLPVVPGPARHVLTLGGSAPTRLPVLQVETEPWQVGDEALLPGTPACHQHLGPQQQVLAVACATSGSPDQLDWVDGVLEYTAGSGVPTGRGDVGADTALARGLIARLNPGLPASSVTGGQAASPAGIRTYVATEMYAGEPLWNGRWTVAVGPHSIVAQRYWLQVVGPDPAHPAAPLISPARALGEADRLYTGAAVAAGGQQLALGYYAATVEAPNAAPWDVYPAYRIHVGAGACIYINALAGAAPSGAPGATAAAGAAQLVSPQSCE